MDLLPFEMTVSGRELIKGRLVANAGQGDTRVDGLRLAWPISTAPIMPKITYIDTDGTARTVDAETGSTVMETAINHDIPGILATCGGSCSCATCHVYVREDWFERLPAVEIEELDMLDTAHDLKPNSRLSCQIKVTEELDGLTVTTPPRQI